MDNITLDFKIGDYISIEPKDNYKYNFPIKENLKIIGSHATGAGGKIWPMIFAQNDSGGGRITDKEVKSYNIDPKYIGMRYFALHPVVLKSIRISDKVTMTKEKEQLKDLISNKNCINIVADSTQLTTISKTKNILLNSTRKMSAAGLTGIKLASARKINEIAYNRLKSTLTRLGIPSNDPGVKIVIQMCLPLILHPLALTFENKIPYISHVKDLLEISFTDAISVNSAELIKLATSLFKEMYLSEKVPQKMRININYNKYNKNHLIKNALTKGLEVPKSFTKKYIIALLQEADQEEFIQEKLTPPLTMQTI